MKRLFYERGEDKQQFFSTYRYLQLAIVALAGVVISFLLYNSSLQLEVSKLTAEYDRAVESRVNALQKELYHRKCDITTIASFFSSSQNVTGEEFRVFTEPLLEYTQSFQALYWAPRIRTEVRGEYEAAAHRGNHTEPGITELDETGRLVPAGQRDEYFPAYYVEPCESNRMILGYDLASDPASYEALARSRDSGKAAVSSPVQLIQAAGKQNGFLTFVPVYRKNALLGSVEDRRRNLLGFGIGAFRAVDFVIESSHHLRPVDIETRLLDVTDPENPVLLCQLRGDKPVELISSGGAKRPGFIEELYRRLDIDIGGRIWRVESSPTNAFISLWRTPTPLLLLIIGLFATSVFVGLAILNIRNNHQVRQFAQAQTAAREELIREVKDHKRTEEKLHLMHKIVEQADDSIAVASKEGYIQYCNPSWAKMHGYETPDELLGKHLGYFHTEAQMQEEVVPFNEQVMKNGVYQDEVGHKRRDGTTFPTLMATTLMKDDDDNVIGFTGIARDITELKRAEEVLQEANKTLEGMNQRIKENYNQLVQSEKMASIGYLAAGVAHEINNPVGFVKSNLGTLADYVHTFSGLFQHYDALSEAVTRGDMAAAVTSVDEIKEIKKKEDMQYILGDVGDLLKESIEGAERVRDIVQNLKSFARADEGLVEDADINEGINSTVKVIWNELKYKCTMHKKLGTLPLIPCNLAQLNQVFMNLLVNAAHAIEEKGDVTIETEAVGENIIIRISDTGVGIPKKNIPRLFDPFFTTKPQGKGTGLGLSISHNIISKHNGTIDVESKVGKGTTFIISLPAKGIKDEK